MWRRRLDLALFCLLEGSVLSSKKRDALALTLVDYALLWYAPSSGNSTDKL